ncbi:MAG TPA: metalloregulator ArsR/SmtB family transcription factor [Opitutaceae bacterium]|jgi:ArsR family transcriptional regulator|nr:metalloregulator ArsR/SmtB family transcription factor [Opitutaceae bacterium]
MNNLVTIYECLCDQTRLRILNLLCAGPLCVCHIQEILNEPQVKISKHLGYLKAHGMVNARREGNWRIYSLVAKRTKALESNLACLQDCAAEDKVFRRDSEKLNSLRCNLDGDAPACCAKPQPIMFKVT